MTSMTNEQTVNSAKIYETARTHLGQHLATNNVLGCAETVNNIFTMALGHPIGGGQSTQAMYPCLQDTTRFRKVGSLADGTLSQALPGDVVISPTGAPGAKFAHGHVGIIAKYGILSNSSSDGRLHENYDIETWVNYFHTQGNFPVEIYRVI